MNGCWLVVLEALTYLLPQAAVSHTHPTNNDRYVYFRSARTRRAQEQTKKEEQQQKRTVSVRKKERSPHVDTALSVVELHHQYPLQPRQHVAQSRNQYTLAAAVDAWHSVLCVTGWLVCVLSLIHI